MKRLILLIIGSLLVLTGCGNKEDSVEITYEKMRESVCVIFRMMGYADEDIWEYMENCFDSIVWPWEYYSLLV